MSQHNSSLLNHAMLEEVADTIRDHWSKIDYSTLTPLGFVHTLGVGTIQKHVETRRVFDENLASYQPIAAMDCVSFHELIRQSISVLNENSYGASELRTVSNGRHTSLWLQHEGILIDPSLHKERIVHLTDGETVMLKFPHEFTRVGLRLQYRDTNAGKQARWTQSISYTLALQTITAKQLSINKHVILLRSSDPGDLGWWAKIDLNMKTRLVSIQIWRTPRGGKNITESQDNITLPFGPDAHKHIISVLLWNAKCKRQKTDKLLLVALDSILL